MPDDQFFYTPESIFILSPDAPTGLQIDVLECILTRVQSVLLLLSQQYDGAKVDRLGDETLSFAIDDIRGNLKLAQKIVEFALNNPNRLC